jgi:hypothetical protein
MPEEAAFEVEIGKSTMESGNPPSVVLSFKAAAKIRAWTLAAPGEISGFGSLTEKVEGFNTILYVDDVWLMEQDCGQGHSTISTAGIFKFMDRQVAPDQNVRFWWHSHAGFGLFWSGIDKATQYQLSETAHWLCLVTNKETCRDGVDGLANSLAAYFAAKPLRISWQKLPIEVESIESSILDEAAEELRGMITNLPSSGVMVKDSQLYIPGWGERSITPDPVTTIPASVATELEPDADVPADEPTDITNPKAPEVVDGVN